eukprot:Protomagalhaensia_sp_Gyna_25__2980@NODE_2755_length_903_cov_87_020833_g2299_i0_p1_GENE_NODE_2755_length_903_cov_87_020833_g2299_i0NODE_2755_length_903_cov_87_020833_g2299_i0_p1_ORF_typecomplete_len180_score36_55GSHPx/PF00255_19/2_5e35AhpCTSA/PF00578_21/4_7e08Redoxin/PF08534_10/8_4e06Thioredoxin_8/PF13905_6/0_00062Thioredoxin/PF00085_20/2_7Thioredoxin/PF00085_20/11MGS/PF02142_22/0_069_NODE_2755_length_903_cov_87_020833_g2299_i0150689
MFGSKLTITAEERNQPLLSLEWPRALDGSALDLGALKGKVLLLTNSASKCGLTDAHYKELESLYQEFKSQGLEIVAFPCGQFMNQENKDVCKIREHADSYKITFPLTEKIDVNGDHSHPVFQWLKANTPSFRSGEKVSAIGWNFGKFLVNRDGTVADYYGPRTNPSKMRDPVIAALAKH